VLTAEVETARWFEALLLETPPRRASSRRRRQAGGQLADLEFFGALNKAGTSWPTAR
jgi:aspartyl-tRNA(Asn)/glutamyl-tRNA(Gln) amidotransferase subunit B